MKVSELAKSLRMTSKELMVKLKEVKIVVKGPASVLDADAVNRARKALAKSAPKKPLPARERARQAGAAGKTAATARATRKLVAAGPKGLTSRAAPAAVSQKPAVAKPLAAPPTLTPPSSKSAAARPASGPAVKTMEPTRAALAPATVHPPAAALAPGVSVRPAPSPSASTAAVIAPPPAVKTPGAAVAAPRPKAGKATAVPAKPAAPLAPPAPELAVVEAPAGPMKRLEVRFPITVKDLAAKMDVKPSDVIKHLMQQRIFVSIVQPLDEATAIKVATAFNHEIAPQPTLEEQLLKATEPDPTKLVLRAPVVTFMGHVDHGKTSLLDAIRQAKVAEKEAGGITQHIGAYEVQLEKGHVTFLDTPGHEAFSALRARGANVTDIVVLVVAGDDGVMPQTIEAIDHATAAGVPIVVAINKMDKPEANPQKVKQQLSQHGLIGEDWGGKTIMVSVSARTRQGIDELLEMLLLEAELLELRADPTGLANGTVIEAKQTKDRGPVATLLVQQGTLHIGQTLVIGHLVGRVRAMHDDRGRRIKEAGPAKPIEVLGLPEVPQAGDRFLVVPDEKAARQLAEQRQERREQRVVSHRRRITLEELHSRIAEGKLKDLRLILKADVQGSLEAITQSLQKLDVEKEEVQFKILHAALGDINESDVILAAASDAIIVGFHVGIEPKVQVLAAAEGVDVHIYQIIYELIGAIKAAIEGLLEPTVEETFIGRAEVRRLFQVSKSGIVAGCMVTKGMVRRDCTMRVIRGRERIVEAKMANLKRVKDDVREVQEGLECGILLEGNVDIQLGDLLEAWDLKKVARKLA